MADARETGQARPGMFLAGGFFKISVICLRGSAGHLGRQNPHILFGYNVFNQQPMSPGEGQQVTVVIKGGRICLPDWARP